MSGANVKLIEDRPEVTDKIIQISGTPEQAERAQSLLQGFILSSKYLYSLFRSTLKLGVKRTKKSVLVQVI